MFRNLLPFALLVLLLITASQNVFASSGQLNVTAFVSVGCPFSVALSPQNPIFLQSAGATINYSIVTLTPCSIPHISGNFVLANSVSNIAYYTANEVFNSITQTPTEGQFIINSSVLQLGNGKATLTLNSLNASNSSQISFQVVTGANIFISEASISPANPSIGALLTASTNVTNDGSLASSNMMLNVLIRGPNAFSYSSNVALGPLSPSQAENSIFYISGATAYSGTYDLFENVSYQTSFTESGNTYVVNAVSSTVELSYTVPSTGGGGGGGGAPPQQVPTSIALLTFTQTPLGVSVLAGNNTAVTFGLHDNSTRPIWVNITLPTFPYGSLNISAHSVLLQPNQTQFVQLLLTGAANISQSVSYILPLNFSVATVGERPTYGQFYTSFRISSLRTPSQLLLQSSTYAFSLSSSIVTQFSVYNPTSKTIFNAQLSTQLPTSAVKRNLSVSLTGGVHNVTLQDGEYILKWRIPELQSHATSILTYSLSNVTAPQYFLTPTTTLSTLTQPGASELRVFNVSIPTFYVGRAENISISALYTGTNNTNVTVNLVPPTGVYVSDQVQKINVFPNTVFSMKFRVSAIRSSGTSIFQLMITSPVANESYVLPVVVLPQGLNSSAATTTIQSSSPQPIPSINGYVRNTVYIIGAAVILLIVIAVYIFYRRIGSSRYNPERAKQMVRMKQRVRREMEGNEGEE